MKKAALIAILILLTLPIAYNVITSYLSDYDIEGLPKLGSGLRIWESLSWTPGCLIPGLPGFRPITWFILAVMTRIFGTHFHLYHASLFSCHLLNAILLFLFALSLTKNRVCALITALLFFFNQANTETLCRPFSNSMIHAVTFTLLTLICIARFCTSERRAYLFAAVLFCNMALYASETCLILLLYIPLFTEIFFFHKLRPSQKMGLFFCVFLSSALFLAMWLMSKASLWVPSVAKVNFWALLGNTRWTLVNLFLPYEDMCFSASGTFFIALYFLLGYAYVFSFSQFLVLSKARNKLFVFGVSCLMLYVLSISKFIVYERVLYYACPFYALVIGSLCTVEEGRARRCYRISVAILCALLLTNNYSLLLLRTRDWSIVGGLTRDIMRYFGEHIDTIRTSKLHAVSLYPHRLLYLRGKPLLGPIDEMYLNCLWFNGRDPGELLIYGENLILWRDAREIALAYKSGGPVKEDDPLIALTKERINGSYHFQIFEGKAGDFLRGRLEGVERPGSSFPVRVNFQLIHSFVPLPGYEIDEGKRYESWRGYGWDRDIYGEDRDFERRHCVDPDAEEIDVQLKDTFVFTDNGKAAAWSVDLPNGDYLVSLCWGDPMFGRPPQIVTLQGNVAAGITKKWTKAGEFITVSNIPVSVRNGRMVMKITPGVPNSPAIINYLVIERKAAIAK